jgi:hypothetical protein
MEDMYKVPEKITTIVKGTKAKYLYCEASCLIYEVETDDYKYEFGIDQSDRNDIGNATFNRHEKAIHLMRYINKAIKNETLKWVKK